MLRQKLQQYGLAASMSFASLLTAQADTITIGGVGAGAPSHWAIYNAIAKNIFKDLGVDVSFTPIATSASVAQQVVAGSLNIGSTGAVDTIRAIQQGAPLTILRVQMAPSGYEIYARPSIKKIADLRGKTVMIGGPKDITRYYMDALLAKGGLKAGDYDYVFAGATSQRYAALVAGSVDATIVVSPFNFTARDAGFTNLGPPPPETEKLPFVLFSMRTDWAQQHASDVKKFLEGFQKGIDFFYDPKNEKEAVDILQKASNAPRGDVEKTYAFYRDMKMFDRVGAVTPDTVRAVVQLLQADGDWPRGQEPDISRFIKPGLTVTEP